MALQYPKRCRKTYRLYSIWIGMKVRCYNKNDRSYEYCGAKGIRICDSWLNFDNFENWAIKNGYKNTLEIDRIDNSIGYKPSNCRWVNQQIQSNNRRCVKKISFNGLDKTLKEWADYLGIKRSTLAQRYYVYKWSIQKVLSA